MVWDLGFEGSDQLVARIREGEEPAQAAYHRHRVQRPILVPSGNPQSAVARPPRGAATSTRPGPGSGQPAGPRDVGHLGLETGRRFEPVHASGDLGGHLRPDGMPRPGDERIEVDLDQRRGLGPAGAIPWCQVVEATSRRSYASRGVGPS